MTREEIRANILDINNNCILAELPTSIGKSRIALDFMANKNIKGNILIVIPKLILIDNWKKEFVKWGYEPFLKQVTFSTYISLPKHVNTIFDLVIFDECHHLSERAREAVEDFTSQYYILLSATVTKALKKEIKLLFPGIECCKISMREAIEDAILPDPKVYLIPLQLNSKDKTETLVINKGAKGKAVKAEFRDRFIARKNKLVKYNIQCTQEQYHQDLCSMIDYYKTQYMRTNNQIVFFRWQQKALERLKWLAGLKNDIVKDILKKLKNKRTLTFCNSIEQTEKLGKYCINSKNKESNNYLEMFNRGEINHITACDILNEGEWAPLCF